MAWNVLSAFTAYQRLTSTAMEAIRQNLNTLKAPQTAISDVTAATDFTTTGTSFADVSTTWYQVTLTPSIAAGTCSIRVWANFPLSCSVTTTVYAVRLDLMVDGVSVSGAAGIALVQGNSNQIFPVNINYVITGVATGAHTIKLRWRVASGGTATIYANNGGATQARAQMGAMEI